jgi:hypothetical protein
MSSTELDRISTSAYRTAQSVSRLRQKMTDSTMGPSYLAYTYESRMAVRDLDVAAGRASWKCDLANDAGDMAAAVAAAAEVTALLKQARAVARKGAPKDTDPDAAQED